MIISRFTKNDWLQVIVQSDNATNQIESFQSRVTNSELTDFVSCLKGTLQRFNWIETNYHEDKSAQEAYNQADVVRVGSFVTISYISIHRVHLIFRSSTMYLSIDDLEPLISSLESLLDS